MGPLAYVVGYCLHKLYRESKNSPHWNSERSQELQALLLSLKDDSASVEFVSSFSRGGLWTPCSSVIDIGKAAEQLFRSYTLDEKKSIPADKIVNSVLCSPEVLSLWQTATANLVCPISKECRKLCLENIVMLYVRVRCFSHAKDIINKCTLKDKTQRQKGLRTCLKWSNTKSNE